MDKTQIVKLIQKMIQNQNLRVGSLSVSSHTHNGGDSPQIQSVNVDTLTGFTFGTTNNNVYIQYDESTNTFKILEGQTPSTVNMQLGSFKNIEMLANGTGVGDHFALLFSNSPKGSQVLLDANDAILQYTPDGGTTVSGVDAYSGTVEMFTDDGTDSSSVVLTPTLLELIASGDFAIQLPSSTLPSPVEGMIAYDGTNFRGVDSSGTWKTFTLT